MRGANAAGMSAAAAVRGLRWDEGTYAATQRRMVDAELDPPGTMGVGKCAAEPWQPLRRVS